VAPPLESFDYRFEKRQKAPVVGLAAEDLLAPVASSADVVETPGELETKRAWHAAEGTAERIP